MNTYRKPRSLFVGEKDIEKLKKRKKENDWTYEDIAQKAYLNKKTVERFFRRIQPIDSDSAIAKTLFLI